MACARSLVGTFLCLLALSAGLVDAATVPVQQVPAAKTAAGFRGLPPLPTTDKGSRFHNCFLKLSDNIQPAILDLRINETMDSQSHTIDPQLSEQVALQMTEAQVDAYCAITQSTDLVTAMAHAAGSKQPTAAPSVSKGTPSSNHATTTAAATTTSTNKDKKAQSSSAVAKVASFTSSYTTDATTGLYQPHDAEYPSPPGYNLQAIYDLLPSGVYSSTDGKTRSDAESVAIATSACIIIDEVKLIVTTVCASLGTAGVWAGGGLIAEGGVWSAPADTLCLIPMVAAEAASKACITVVGATTFIDGLIDSAEIQGAYENGMKALDNQLVLWNKMNYDYTALTNLITYDYLAIQANINKTGAEINKNIDDTRNTITKNIDFTRVVLRADIANALTVISSQICDLKSDVARVQRESNYLRKLLLLPEAKRPGYKQCEDACPSASPQYCKGVNITYVPYQDRSIPTCPIDEKCKGSGGYRSSMP